MLSRLLVLELCVSLAAAQCYPECFFVADRGAFLNEQGCCEACRVGYYCPDARQIHACPTGTFAPKRFHVACTAATVCDGATTTEIVPPTTSSDRQCGPVTACVVGQTFETRVPTPTSDRRCDPVTACAAPKVEEAAPTLTSDRRCACPTTHYAAVDGTCHPCVVAIPACLRCRDATQCLECWPLYTLQNNGSACFVTTTTTTVTQPPTSSSTTTTTSTQPSTSSSTTTTTTTQPPTSSSTTTTTQPPTFSSTTTTTTTQPSTTTTTTSSSTSKPPPSISSSVTQAAFASAADNDTAAIGAVTVVAAAVAGVCFIVIVVVALVIYAKRRKARRPAVDDTSVPHRFYNPQFRPLPQVPADRIYEHITDNSYEIPVPQYDFASEAAVTALPTPTTYAVPVRRPRSIGARVEPDDGYLGVTPEEEAMYDLATMVHDDADEEPLYDLGTTSEPAVAADGYIDVGADPVDE